MDRNNWDDQQGGGYGGRSQQYSSRNYNNYNNRSSGGRGGGGGGGQRDGGYRGSRNNDSYSSRPSNNSFENSNKELMFVETGKVGRIIGRGGSKIRELQEESGARINVNNNNVDGGNTGIDLIGSEDCIEKAKSLIYELLNNDRYSN